MPDAGGCYLLPRLVGLHRAKELLFLGDDCPAAEAERIGLVNRVVPAAELDARADELAAKFLHAARPRRSTLTKRLVNRSFESSREQSFDDEAFFQELIVATGDSPGGHGRLPRAPPPRVQGLVAPRRSRLCSLTTSQVVNRHDLESGRAWRSSSRTMTRRSRSNDAGIGSASSARACS